MSLSADDKKKLMIVGPLGLIALGALAWELAGFFTGPSNPSARTAPPPAVTKAQGVAGYRASNGNAAVKLGSTSAELDPTLHEEGMLAAESVVYGGTGRNIFAPGAAEAPLTKVAVSKYPARSPEIVPVAITTPVATKPAINLKFFGTATQNGVRKALLLSGDDVFLAANGDVVQRRYRVVSIAANSILVEDLPNSNQQSLPLLAN